MATGPLLSLVLILVLGVGATWLAWKFDLPSILLLLIAGFLAGPVAGWIDPDALFGELLLPFVSFSVAIILFEGGLSLRTIELEEIGGVVRNLVTVGVVATWAVTAAAAYLLLGLGLDLSLLLGAVLVVTGPTVILPLLRHLRPKGHVGNVLKWEGILIDPIGVILGVVVFEAILVGGVRAATAVVVTTVAKALLIGGLLGLVGAGLTYLILKRHWVPGVLHSPATLAIVGAAFVAAEFVQSESGLVAATVMGVVLANRGDLPKRHIIEFKENLRTLLIAFLFVILAARLELSDLAVISPRSLAFLAVLFFVARPLGVWLSTIGSRLSLRERTFLAAMAPRGIVAAAISSVFALEFARLGYPGADQLVPITFLVIIGTVGIYGLIAGPLGRRLDIADPNPQGVVIVGAHRWARELGVAIQELGLRVVLVDTNRRNLQQAWDMGLRTEHGNTLDEAILDELNLDGIGNVLAVTPNDEVNSLTALHFQELFDRSDVFQLSPGGDFQPSADRVPQDLRGRLLFEKDLTFARIHSLYHAGWRFTIREVEEGAPFPWAETEEAYPLFLRTPEGELEPFTEDADRQPQPGDKAVVLEPPEDEEG